MKWNIKTLKKYFDQRFKLEGKARKLARKLMNKRLDGMNHIKEQLDEQIERFVTKDELRLRDQKIETLQYLVYIGLGICLALELYFKIKK